MTAEHVNTVSWWHLNMSPLSADDIWHSSWETLPTNQSMFSNSQDHKELVIPRQILAAKICFVNIHILMIELWLVCYSTESLVLWARIKTIENDAGAKSFILCRIYLDFYVVDCQLLITLTILFTDYCQQWHLVMRLRPAWPRSVVTGQPGAHWRHRQEHVMVLIVIN